MGVRAEIRKILKTFSEDKEFDFTSFTHLKSGGQALTDLKDMGEILIVGRRKQAGCNSCNVYKVAPRRKAMIFPTEAMEFLLSGKPRSKPPKGKKVTIHRIGL